MARNQNRYYDPHSYARRHNHRPSAERPIKSVVAWAVGGLALAAAVTAGVGSMAGHNTHRGIKEHLITTPTATTSPNEKVYFYEVGGAQFHKATSVSAKLSPANPRGAVTGDGHTEDQIAVSNPQATERVEIGNGIGVNSASNAHEDDLFVNRTVDGHSLYSQQGGGYVQVSKSMRPGDPVKPGMSTYGIKYDPKDGGRWDLLYGEPGHKPGVIGYYPRRVWEEGVTFTESDYNGAFGEVESAQEHPDMAMGNGRLGTAKGAARIEDFRLRLGNVPVASHLVPFASTFATATPSDASVPLSNPQAINSEVLPATGGVPPLPYDYGGHITGSGLNFGGPGYRNAA